MDDTTRAYRTTLERARDDPDVLGVILSGSRAVETLVTRRSDFDCYVILKNPNQQAMFRDFDALARKRGYAELVDDWHPDVPFFRGEGTH